MKLTTLLIVFLLLRLSQGGITMDKNVYYTLLETTKGDVVIKVYKSWAPFSAARFNSLVQQGFYNDVPFFRVLFGNSYPSQYALFGISPDPIENANWFLNPLLPEVTPAISNEEGFIGFWSSNGTSCCKTTQILINLRVNNQLNAQNVVPFGSVVSGMENLVTLYNGYGSTVDYSVALSEGSDYFRQFPKLDYIKRARICPSEEECVNNVADVYVQEKRSMPVVIALLVFSITGTVISIAVFAVYVLKSRYMFIEEALERAAAAVKAKPPAQGQRLE